MKQNTKQVHTVLRAALALCTVLALILGCTGLGWAVDLSRACSVTVSLGSGELSDALRQADLTVDLYLVAGAMAVDGEDAIRFEPAAPYAALPIPDARTQEDWNALAQQASALARSGDSPRVHEAPVETPITGESGLTPGLYLLLIHGRGETELGPNGETVAYAGAYRYLFAPQLISLPTREAPEDGVATTASGAWLYDVTVYPKPEVELAYGSLLLTKTLQNYDPMNTALFVFSVEATLDGENVYSDVVSMTFDAACVQSIVIDRLPIGAVVTVSECYCSPGYELVSQKTLTLTIEADPETGGYSNQVQFVNSYVGSMNLLRCMDNHFTYDEDAGWVCTQIPIPD